MRDVVGKVSTDIMTHINQAATVNSINLLSSVLLATPNQSVDEKELARYLEMFQSIIKSLDYSEQIEITERSGIEQIQHAEKLKMIKRRSHELGDIIFSDAKQALSLTYYRNNILHLMALPSIIACCFFNVRTSSRDEISHLISLTYPFVQHELFLSWDKKQLNEKIDETLVIMTDLGLLLHNENNDSFSRRSSSTKEYSQLMVLAKIISPMLEVYYLTIALLSRNTGKKISKPELVNHCILMAQRVAMIHELNSPDYSDKHLISNFIDALINIDYVKVCETEHIEYSEIFHRTNKRIRQLLPKEMRSNILQMIEDKTE